MCSICVDWICLWGPELGWVVYRAGAAGATDRLQTAAQHTADGAGHSSYSWWSRTLFTQTLMEQDSLHTDTDGGAGGAMRNIEHKEYKRTIREMQEPRRTWKVHMWEEQNKIQELWKRSSSARRGTIWWWLSEYWCTAAEAKGRKMEICISKWHSKLAHRLK